MNKNIISILHKKKLYGHNVSKSNKKTQRIFKVNKIKKKIGGFFLKRVKIDLSISKLKQVEKRGGVDIFFIKKYKYLFNEYNIRKNIIKYEKKIMVDLK